MKYSPIDVSVVVPTFNRRTLVTETLSAVLNQTVPPREVIVVDDGSTDGTEAAVRSFPVRYIRQDNAGQNAARARGAAMATGDWIAFCDDDDLWRPKFFETMAAYVRPGIAYGFANFVPVANGVWGSRDKFADAPAGFFDTPDQPLYPKVLEWLPILPSNSIVRRDYFHSIGGIDLGYGRANCQDFELALRCVETAPVAIAHDILVGIRRHATQQTANKLNMQLGRMHALRWSRDRHRSAGIHADILEHVIADATVIAMEEAFVQGRLDVVRDLVAGVPGHLRSAKLRLKLAVARSRIPGGVVKSLVGR